MKRICIVGAGAIGGFIGARLAHGAKTQVSALARGATLSALRTHGWRLHTATGSTLQAPAHASDDAKALGEQDYVIIAVKGPALSAVTQSIQPLLGNDTVVVPAMNGVPWWFCHDVPAFSQSPLRSIDPHGTIESGIDYARVVGCVVHASALTPEPGVVQQKMGQGIILGEPRGAGSPRVHALVDLLTHAGFDATQSTNIRYDIWYKLWGNMTMNPISALTGATMDRILADPLLREFCSTIMREAAAVGAAIGCAITQAPEDRHAITAKLGAVKTSMLQDVEADRPIELDALVGAVHEIGRRMGVATPAIDSLLGLTRLFATQRGLMPS